MNKIFRTVALFSRRAQKQIDPQVIQRQQIEMIEEYEKKRFKLPDEFKHQDTLYEEVVYGNKCDISGITQNNIKSAQFTQQVISQTKPKLIILGGLNDTQAMGILQQPIGRFHNIDNMASSKLYCKSTLLPIIQKRLEQEINYMYDKKKKMIWKVDQLNRCFEMNDYLNAAYDSLFLDSKIIYGKPSSVFIFQDLMLTLSLQDLQEILENTITKVYQTHSHSCQHIAPVVLEQIKTHSMFDQPRLYSKEITYTTALLNRLTKIDSRNLLLIPTCFVSKIAENVHHTDFEPQSVYRKWTDDPHSQSFGKFSQIIKNQKIHELMQKFAILSILKGFHLELVLHQGKNFFKNSIFSDLLGKYSAQQIIDLYEPYKMKHMQKLFQIQRQRIKNKIEYHPPQTEYMYLKDQFDTLQKRQKTFLYEFQPKNYITEAENQQKLKNLFKKIDQIVDLECDEYEKRLIEEYNKGNRSKQNIILYSKLIGKANVELKQKVRLPYFHFNAFRGFYKEYYRDSLLFDKDLKERKLDMKRMRKIQENFNRIGKQIKDPQMIRKYLTGEMGQVKQLNMYEDENGEIDMDGELDDLQDIIAELGNEDMKKDFDEFRKANPRKENDQLGDDDHYDEDQHDSEDDTGEPKK